MIYVLQAENGGPIKIGESGVVGDRVNVLASFFPYPVEVITSFEGGRREEKFIHECFRPVTIQGIKSNEWFSSCPAIWRFILDAIDNGRPSFLPDDLGSCDSDDARQLATDLFGGEREAMVALGYSSGTPTKDTFNAVTRHVGGIWPRLLFEAARRDGSLPRYISELHEDAPEATGGKVKFNDFLVTEAAQ